MSVLSKQLPHSYARQLPIYQETIKGADHIDIKSVVSDASMNEFIAGVFSYQPEWVTFLYRIRWGFVRLLGMKQEGIPQAVELNPDDMDFKIGDKTSFFTVDAYEADSYLFESADESHLKATLGIIREPLDEVKSRYYVVTVVHYHNWTGSVYFNVIRPFHHLVVAQMLNAGGQA